MRIRQVKPEFRRDAKIADLPPVTRLTYIGLWMLADDAGWFRLDVPAIALELYGWEGRKRREAMVGEAVVKLVDAKRIESHECGHGFIPRFRDHQRFSVSAKQVFTFKKEHESHLPAGSSDTPAGDRDTPTRIGMGNGSGTGNGTGTSGHVKVDARKRDEDDEPSEFQARVPRPAA